jgi:hypothetical protein
MYETYKRDGFDEFYVYVAEKRSCTDELMNFFKLNFEPMDPIAKSDDPYDLALQEAMGACGNLDLAVACIDFSCRGFIGGYEVYWANFDDKKGDEVLLIGKEARRVGSCYYNEEGQLICKYIWSDHKMKALFFLFNTSDNCVNSLNSDKLWYFFERGQFDRFHSNQRYAMWRIFFNPMRDDIYYNYGVAQYNGRGYAYTLEARDNDSYDLSIGICTGQINIFNIPQR